MFWYAGVYVDADADCKLELVIDLYSVQVRCISLEQSEIQLLVQVNLLCG